ncbi:hypothetical protein [Microbacterium halophytorum]|uniref:hypothetical protein n=1 Tax=Microbacterium halophytorum TaxID=2067568 RepID=UPI000CFCD978|nr:hypothetical protein [Microbacterium halophytorum]
MTIRRMLMAIALAFACYFLIRGIVIVFIVPHPALHVAAVVIWAAALAAALWLPGEERDGVPAEKHSPSRLPLWAAIAVVVAVVAAQLLAVAASGEKIHEPIVATMFGAAGQAFTVVAVRRRPGWAWGGVCATAVIGVSAMGIAHAQGRGLLGTFLWVAVAQLLVWAVDRARHDTAELMRLQQTAASWQAAQEARRTERRERVRFALAEAGPVLTKVVSSGGMLDEEERDEALIAEGTLRDELRAHRLLDAEVRGAIRRARMQGVSVTVTDDDALTDLDAAELRKVRHALSEALRGTDADRIIIRTSATPTTAVTIVGRSASPTPDDDGIAMWQEIPRP